jgi:hypothetical protein
MGEILMEGVVVIAGCDWGAEGSLKFVRSKFGGGSRGLGAFLDRHLVIS